MRLSRADFFEQYRSLFSWYDADEYACFQTLTIAPDTVQAIQQAAVDSWKVLLQAGEVMKTLDDEDLIAFGYPPETLAVIRACDQSPFIARCDFAVTAAGIYLLECNAEVATFVVETFKMNGIVANYFDQFDPNLESEFLLQKELNHYLETAAAYIGKSLQNCHVVFSALSQADEDIGTVEYLRSLCSQDATFCPIEQIAMDEYAAYDHQGRPIDILYRLYPTEWIVDDRDPISGIPLWGYLERLILKRKLALINPVSSFVLQNKALLALITELWGDGGAQSDVDNAIASTVQRHFLPTYLDASKLVPPYVGKPTYGREGKEVDIIRTKGLEKYNPSQDYENFPKVYQRYVEMPTVEIDEKLYTLQLSCFVINGNATGVAARIGNTVIGNTSKFVSIGYS